MKRFLKTNWLILVIVFLGTILRFYKLGIIPPSLMWDEAALGYNAFSVLKTGRDEYGNFLPLVFKSFGDFKPGLYVYLTVPFVAILGLTELAVRCPSAVLGILTIVFVYRLVSEQFTKTAGLAAAFVLAINPWHIEFSRGAWEANLAVFLVVLGVFFFFRSFVEKKYLLLSAFLFGLTFLAYQGAKVFTPLLLLGLLIFYGRKVSLMGKKTILGALLLFSLSALPILWGMTHGEGGRAKAMSLFSYSRKAEEIQEILRQDKTSQDSPVFAIFHSESLNFARGFLGRYFNHFSGRFLFFEGDFSNKRLGVPYMGVFYLADLIFFFLGIYYLAQQKEPGKKFFLLWWFFVAPLPAAVTRDSVSAVRALNMVVPWVIIVGLGLFQFFSWLRHYSLLTRLSLSAIYYTLYAICGFYFLDQYFVHAPIFNSSTSQYGYREVVNFVAPKVNEYKRIIITQKYGQPYIYWLFYTQYDPRRFQKQANFVMIERTDVGTVEQIDNLYFRNFHWLSDINVGDLFVGDDSSLPIPYIAQVEGAKLLHEISFLDGKPAFRIVERKNNE